MFRILLVALFFALVLVAWLQLAAAAPPAGIINVDQSNLGCVSSPQGNPYSVVYCEIGDAISDASDGDTVLVASGTYTKAVDSGAITLTVSGAGQGSTFIDGTGVSDSVVDVFGGSVVTITGVTIQDGTASW